MEQRILELEQEKMRSVCLGKMIDIAEGEFKVAVRKSLVLNKSKIRLEHPSCEINALCRLFGKPLRHIMKNPIM
jgi:hypothetical protein